MQRTIQSAVLAGFVVVLGAIVWSTGMIQFSGPSFPDFTRIDVDLTLPKEARITAIEPISLDCRARVFAEIPVEGRREHEAFGRVYRTDRITMTAFGDVDTCVDGSGTEVTHNRDGSTEVVIDARSIVFVRPRVDAVRTAATVDVDKGAVGKLVDAFPWVDDNLGLTPAAYAYAQNVIGGSECTRTAYDLTRVLLVDAYREQVVDQGVDPDTLTVTIEGQPDFTDPEPLDSGEIEMWAGAGEVVCRPSDELGGVAASSRL